MELKVKLYIVVWQSGHNGDFFAGAHACATKEDAKKVLKDFYRQAICNITPNNKEKELTVNDRKFDSNPDQWYYYITREQADSWEKGEVYEQEL